MAGTTTTTTRFPPPEVLDVIFSNLERTDLLNSRLVSKDWNQDCLKFFKKPSSKFRITLSHRKDWINYVKFVSSLTKNVKVKLEPVMPIHLKLKVPDPDRDSDPVFVNSDYTSSDESDSDNGINSDSGSDDDNVKYTKKFKAFRITVYKLRKLFGSECVRDLTFCYPNLHEDGLFNKKFVKVFRKLSPGLEKLEIKLDPDFPAIEGQEMFPKLKDLSIDWFNGTAWGNGRNIAWKLILACPNLETLSLGTIYEKDTQPWPEGHPFPPGGIKSFKFNRIPHDWLLRKMMEHPSLPPLEKLELKENWKFRIIGKKGDPNFEKISTCQEILRLFSPSLRSLSIPLISPKFGYRSPSGIENVSFPVFPALKQLTIQDFDFLNCDSDSSFRIDPSAFPVLESVSLPFDIKLNEDHEDNTEFPNVKYLEYFLYGNYEDEDERERKQKMDKIKIMDKFVHFHRLFPNVSTIAFRNNNESTGLEYGALIKQHLQKFMQLPGAAASKIKVLELINFDQNYLGVLLNQIRHPPRFVLENMGKNPLLEPKLLKTFEMLTTNTLGSEVKIQEEKPERLTIVELDYSDFHNYLTNVEKIRLVLTQEARRNFREEEYERINFEKHQDSIDEPKKLYLDEMIATFPHLEEIEVSSAMFACWAPGHVERMQKIMKKFPGLTINVI